MTDLASELMRLRFLAYQVRNNRELRAILRSARPALRRSVYEAIRPHLRFKPKPYLLLK